MSLKSSFQILRNKSKNRKSCTRKHNKHKKMLRLKKMKEMPINQLRMLRKMRTLAEKKRLGKTRKMMRLRLEMTKLIPKK